MRSKRLEFTEARFALTIIICLSVAIGYIALHHLGGTDVAPPLEARPPIATIPEQVPAPAEEDQPQVLPIDPQPPMISSTQVPDRPAPTHRDDTAPGTSAPEPPGRLELR